MQKQNYSRSNVNERTLSISAPDRSSFDMSHSVRTAFKLGVLHPVNLEYLTPTDMLSGNMSPNIQLEKITTPEMGRLRLDTHSFVVAARRINKDWRQFAESSRDFANLQQKPNFSIETFFGHLLKCLLSPGKDPDDDIDAFNKFGDMVALNEDIDMTDYSQFVLNLLISVRSWYYSLLSDSVDQGYQKDFFAIEYERLKEFIARFATAPNPDYSDYDFTKISFAEILAYIIEPYMGVGSITDMIGYPIFRQYSRIFTALSIGYLESEEVDDYSDSDYLAAVKALKFDEFLLIDSIDYGDATYQTLPAPAPFDEMPYRAIYAAWYDYLRNWHVEKRVNILDPDNFGSTGILGSFATQDNPLPKFVDACQLLLLKYRMFNRDGLTTVQEDDVYRHVYAPIYNSSDAPIVYSNPGDDIDDVVQKALSIVVDGGAGFNSGVSVPFMGDLFNRHDSNPNNGLTYMLDLQTMKRAGMLEKFLARDFYNPDTYAGFIRARYSIEPADIEFLSSVYIGGDEKMFDGEQQISNVATSEMPAGQRTFTGGVALQDGISYRVTDFSYLVSFVSLMPMPEYDVANMHAHELTPFDMPLPDFASDVRVSIRTSDMLRGVEVDDEPILGFVPRYYGYRCRLDEVHDLYLTDKRMWTWLRDWYTMFYTNILAQGGELPFALNAYSLRVHLPVDNFLNLKQWDRIAYGKVDISMSIDRPLPAAVEFI